MKVIPLQETFTESCTCGVSLVVSVDDIHDNWHDGGYFFTCPKCQKYHVVNFASLPTSFKSAIGRRETGH